MKIEKINYFGEETKSEEWNAKVLYYVNGKLRHCLIYICFFSREIYISKEQHSLCHVHPRLLGELRKLNYFNI